MVVLTFIAFYPALHCGFVHYDDPAYVYGNPAIRDGLNWHALKWAFTAMHAEFTRGSETIVLDKSKGKDDKDVWKNGAGLARRSGPPPEPIWVLIVFS